VEDGIIVIAETNVCVEKKKDHMPGVLVYSIDWGRDCQL